MEQLDLAAGLAAQYEGLSRVEAAHGVLLQRLRTVARLLAELDGTVHVDDLRTWAAEHRITVPKPVWGNVFRGSSWIKVGERASAVPTNHGHKSPVWALRK